MKTKIAHQALALCTAALTLITCTGMTFAASPVSSPSTVSTTAGSTAQGTLEWLISPQYDILNSFDEGNYTTAKRGGDWYILDKSGKELLKLPFNAAYMASRKASDPTVTGTIKKIVLSSFQDGLARVNEVHDMIDPTSYGKKIATLGYIDESGKMVIDFSNEGTLQYPGSNGWMPGIKTGIFSNGLTWRSPANVVKWNANSFWFLDKTGNVAFTVPAGEIRNTNSYTEGLCGQTLKNGSIRYFDTQGNVAFSLAGGYADCGSMRNGYAWFSTSAGKEGLLDRNGNIVLAANYDEVGNVSTEGLCYFKDASSGLCGLMKTDGTVVVPAIYKTLYGPWEGLAYASLDGALFGYINVNGEMVVAPQFKAAELPSQGICVVTTQDGKMGAIKSPLA